jgi:hypothetical protein
MLRKNAMQWPIEKGKNDKQWSNKKLYRKLKIEQQDSHLKPGRNSVGNIFLLRVVLLTVKDSTTSGLIIAFILERF